MKKLSKILKFCFAFYMVAGLVLQPIIASAEVPYKTFTENGYGMTVETQTAYTNLNTIVNIGEESLKNPSDMKISDGLIYIADTGNRRVLVCDMEGKFERLIGDGKLKDPKGLFVTEDKVYVADDKLAAIIVYDKAGNELKRYEKPQSIMYGEKMPFSPQKLAVDSNGNMYITSEGNTNGLIQITPTEGGTFLGYFGTNDTKVTPLDVFRDMVFTDEMKKSLMKKVPSSISNLTIDSRGLIYTITKGNGNSSQSPIKKLNLAGTNLLTDIVSWDDDAYAVTVGKYENILVASQDGYILEYNKEGSLLFCFGGTDSNRYREGLFQTVTAINVDDQDNVYVLDSKKAEIQVFEPTEFTNLVHKSLVLYQKGLYTESKEPLEQVIMMNSLFDYANAAMGQATYQEGDYHTALKYFRMAKEWDGYSDAYWEVRNIWLRENLITLVGAIVAIYVILKALKFIDKKKGIYNPLRRATAKIRNNMFFKRLVFGKFYMRHPIDGAYAVRRQGMASFWVTNVLLAILIVINIIYKYFCGFLWKMTVDGRYNIVNDILTVVLAYVVLTVVTYLICTINDGEGTFKQIYSGCMYALAPYFFIKPILFLASRVVTYNEGFIMNFGNFIMMTWVVIMIFLTLKEINNYSVKETVKVIAITIFATFIFILVAFVIYVLTAQVWGFITSVYGEAVYRIANR